MKAHSYVSPMIGYKASAPIVSGKPAQNGSWYNLNQHLQLSIDISGTAAQHTAYSPLISQGENNGRI